MTDLQQTPSGLSMTELRNKLQLHLKSNALPQLKSQLRTMILTGVMQTNAAPAVDRPSHSNRSFVSTLADTLVAQHLQRSGYVFSLSVFGSEAAGKGPLMDEQEARAALNYHGEDTLSSLLERLLTELQKCRGKSVSTESIGVQVSVEAQEPTLEQKLALIDAQYALKSRDHAEKSRSNLERQVMSIKQSLEKETNEEMQRQLKVFRERELGEVRRIEQQRYENILKHKQEEFSEMERTIQNRIVLERERLNQLRQDLELRASELDRRMQDALNSVQQRDEQIASLEGETRDLRARQQRIRSEQLRYEDLAVQRLEELENARLREQRRIDDIRRIQADNALELRLKSEEIAELRLRLKHNEVLPPASASTQPQPTHQDYAVAASHTTRDTNRNSATSAQLLAAQKIASSAATAPAADSNDVVQQQPPLVQIAGVGAQLPELRVAAQLAELPEQSNGIIHTSPPRQGFPSASTSMYDSPSADRTAIDGEKPSHLSQLSSIAGLGVPIMPGDISQAESSDDEAKRTFAFEEHRRLTLQLLDEEEQRRLRIENDAFREFDNLKEQFASQQKHLLEALNMRRVTSGLNDDEVVARSTLATLESKEYSELLWLEKRGRESVTTVKEQTFVPPVVTGWISDNDSDDADQLIRKRGSDSEESF